MNVSAYNHQEHQLDSTMPLAANGILSQRLKEGTSEAHRAAEKSAFILKFMQGTLDAASYLRYLFALRQVYNSMERALHEHGDHPLLSVVHSEDINRSAAIAEDISFFQSHFALESYSDHPAQSTRTYVQRIQHLADGEPWLLIAHHYTRYLGDLSGGQTIGKATRRMFQLPDGEGTAFYTFDAVDSPKQFKDAYRHNLDQLPLTTEQVERIVKEANNAFQLNMLMFNQL